MDADPGAEAESVDAEPVVVARPVRGAVRLWGGLLLAGAAGVLGLAGWLHPDPRGFGTHEQLGTAPCGMLILTGYPCPTCGMTTAFAHAVRGQWWRAVCAQPAGFVFALATLAAGLYGAAALARGRWPRLDRPLLGPLSLSAGVLAVLVLGWIYKILSGRLSGVLPYR